MLLHAGITRILLVTLARLLPAPDLTHTLHRWSDAGLKPQALFADAPTAPAPLTVHYA